MTALTRTKLKANMHGRAGCVPVCQIFLSIFIFKFKFYFQVPTFLQRKSNKRTERIFYQWHYHFMLRKGSSSTFGHTYGIRTRRNSRTLIIPILVKLAASITLDYEQTKNRQLDIRGRVGGVICTSLAARTVNAVFRRKQSATIEESGGERGRGVLGVTVILPVNIHIELCVTTWRENCSVSPDWVPSLRHQNTASRPRPKSS